MNRPPNSRQLSATLLAAGLLGCTPALADLAGISGTLTYYEADGTTETTLADAAYSVLDIHLDFSAENTHGYDNSETLARAIRFANFSASRLTSFVQNDASGSIGSWRPQDSLEMPGIANPLIDSFVTMGGGVGMEAVSNSTDLPFNPWGDATGEAIFNKNLRWHNYNTTQTRVDSDLTIMIGRFVVTGQEARDGANITLNGRADFNYGPGTGIYRQEFSQKMIFTPGPAGLAALALGLGGTRRRRD